MCTLENNRRDGLLGIPCKMDPRDMAVCFDHADSLRARSFRPIFSSLYLAEREKYRVDEDTVLEYDRDEPPKSPSPQDLTISIYYVNNVMLVILRLMGTLKNML